MHAASSSQSRMAKVCQALTRCRSGPMPAWSITELGLSLVPNQGRNSEMKSSTSAADAAADSPGVSRSVSR